MKVVSLVLLSCFSMFGQWITGFYSAQNGVLPPSQVPWGKYTHIIHFAAAPNSNATVDLHYLTPGEIAQMVAARPAGKKLLFCLKDNDNDTNAFPSATSPGQIDQFVNNVAAFTRQYGYDGVDVDWEANVNIAQYSALLTKLRAVMPDKVITMDAGNWSNMWTAAANAASALDQVNVMCYDMDSTGNGYSWFNDALLQAGDSQLLTCDWRMRPFLNAGVPASKLGIGLPFYGRRWTGVTVPMVNGSFSQTTIHYRDLAMDGARFQAQYQNYDNVHKANYLSIPSMNEFDSYVGPEQIRDAAAWQRSGGFGGFMTFTVEYEYIASRSGDAASPLSSALAAEVFGGGAPVASNPPTPAPAPTPVPVPVTPTPVATGQAPVVLSASPMGMLSTPMFSTQLSVVTNVAGTCRYSPQQYVAYSDMTGLMMDQGTSHVATVSNLSSGPNNFYVKCQDASGDTSASDFFVWFNLP